MKHFWIISIFLAIAGADRDPIHVVNKNFNVVMNVDTKEIANELWKIIETNMNQNGESSFIRRSVTRENDVIDELEQVVKKMAQPSRRFKSEMDSEVANNFEEIIRDIPFIRESESNLIQNIADIVKDMVSKAKELLTAAQKPQRMISNRNKPAHGKTLRRKKKKYFKDCEDWLDENEYESECENINEVYNKVKGN